MSERRLMDTVIRLDAFRHGALGWSVPEIHILRRVERILCWRGVFVNMQFDRADDGTPLCYMVRKVGNDALLTNVRFTFAKLTDGFVVMNHEGNVIQESPQLLECAAASTHGGTRDPVWFFENAGHVLRQAYEQATGQEMFSSDAYQCLS